MRDRIEARKAKRAKAAAQAKAGRKQRRLEATRKLEDEPAMDPKSQLAMKCVGICKCQLELTCVESGKWSGKGTPSWRTRLRTWIGTRVEDPRCAR